MIAGVSGLAWLALSVTVEPAILECRPSWNSGPLAVEGTNDGEDRHVRVELYDPAGRYAEVELDLPRGSHKRVVLLPSLNGRVRATLVDGATRTELPIETRVDCKGVAMASLLREDGQAGFVWPRDIGNTAFDAGELRRDDLAASWRVIEPIDMIAAEARALAELSELERAQLEAWIRRGGLLVVVPGADPSSLARTGWLPELKLAARWQEVPLGSGFVVVMTDPSRPDPRVAAHADRALGARSAFRKNAGALFLQQRDDAGPAGRASQPAGTLSLGGFVLAAAIAHELLRRRYIADSGMRSFDRYFKGLGVILGVGAVSGGIAAVLGRAEANTTPIFVARAEGAGLRSRPVLIGGGQTVTLADASFPDTGVRVSFGARVAARNDAAAPRAVLERVAADLGGRIVFERGAAGDVTLRNDTPLSFEAGWIVEKLSCRLVAPLPPGKTVRANVPIPCPAQVADVQRLSPATQLGETWYAATADGVVHFLQVAGP